MPTLSPHFQSIRPSSIRQAQTYFALRTDGVKAINLAIGNVSLPMHPAMQARMFDLKNPESPFRDGVVKYTETVGMTETNQAFLNILKASHLNTGGLYSQITDGGSQGMQLAILGTCAKDKPLLLIDPAYSNYPSMARRLSLPTVSISRTLQADGSFTLPSMAEIENLIKSRQPGAIVVIPYDNPTGQKLELKDLIELGKLAVKYDLWLVSDEAYRELSYENQEVVSVWQLKESLVPGITGRRISLETASKLFNACGLRIGALVTDSQEFHTQSVAENTANLCASAIGQHIFGSLAHLSSAAINTWFKQQRDYYQALMTDFAVALKTALPAIIISKPQSALYSVIDVRNLVDDNFDAGRFVEFCALKGKVMISNQAYTLLLAPMAGFYQTPEGKAVARTQMRIAYVLSADDMALVPQLLKDLLAQYQKIA